MPRIPYPPPDSFPAELPQANMLRMWSHSPSTLRPGMALGTACISNISISQYNKELLTLFCSVKFKCTYIWSRHINGAKKSGVTETQLQALKDEDIHNRNIWDEETVDFLTFVDEIIDHPRAKDETFNKAKKWFNEQQMVEIVTAQVSWLLIAQAPPLTSHRAFTICGLE